jgi:hypothetical protein
MSFPPHRLPPSTPLSGGEPELAPPGTIFVSGDHGGWAVPLSEYTLRFGRDKDEVEVPIAIGDTHVSRQQGAIVCDGHTWWLENRGKRTIHIPGQQKLLKGEGRLLGSGYTLLYIITPEKRTYPLHVRVVGEKRRSSGRRPKERTKEADAYKLSDTERMVLAALAQRYLRGEPHPQPVTWQQTADLVNLAPGPKDWGPRAAEHLVTRVRERLAIPFTSRREMGEPVGNSLNHNLIEALIESGCLLPEHLELFE